MEDSKTIEPETMLPLTPAIFHILLTLSEGPSHGYAVMQEVERMTGGRTVLGPGTLYRSIQRMLVDGIIEEREEGADPTDVDERRRYYSLTEFGRKVAEAEAQRMGTLVELARTKKLFQPCG